MLKGLMARLACVCVGGVTLLLAASSGATTFKYSYDALGRVTFVEDALNGNRDYDYDAAGNRLLVTVGGGGDGANDPATAAPSAPSSLSIPANSTTGNYVVMWGRAAGNVTSYELYEATNPGFSGETRIYGGLGRSYNFNRGDGTYYYRVRACNGTACGSFRVGANGATVLRVPAVPNSLTVPIVAIPGNNYSLSWTSGGGTVGYYNVEQHGNSSYTSLVNSWQSQDLTSTITASTEALFYFRVRACNASGCSGFRNGNTFITVTYPPATPSNLAAILVSFCTWRATWDATPRATSYNVRDTRGTLTNTTFTQASIVWSNNCPATGQPNDNRPDTVNACNLAGCSANAVFVTIPPPGAPASVTVPGTSSVGATYAVSWSTAGGTVERYEIQQSTDPGFGSISQAWTAGASPLNVAATAQGAFYFRVRACNSTGCSGYTNGGNGISILGAPAAPTGLASVQVSFCTWRATWNAVQGATNYIVTDTRGATQSTVQTQASVVWSTTCPQGNPQNNKPMFVRACNSAGCSANSTFP